MEECALAIRSYRANVALIGTLRTSGDPTLVALTWTLSGGDGIRTHGLYIANVALCQLSYTPDEGQG